MTAERSHTSGWKQNEVQKSKTLWNIESLHPFLPPISECFTINTSQSRLATAGHITKHMGDGV